MPAPQPLMRMVCRPAGPQAGPHAAPPAGPPTQLVLFGDQHPAGPRPPLTLTHGPVHAPPFNVPPPRQFPRQFSLVGHVVHYVLQLHTGITLFICWSCCTLPITITYWYYIIHLWIM